MIRRLAQPREPLPHPDDEDLTDTERIRQIMIVVNHILDDVRMLKRAAIGSGGLAGGLTAIVVATLV